MRLGKIKENYIISIKQFLLPSKQSTLLVQKLLIPAHKRLQTFKCFLSFVKSADHIFIKEFDLIKTKIYASTMLTIHAKKQAIHWKNTPHLITNSTRHYTKQP